MHVRELVELGALLGCHGELFVCRAAEVRQKIIEQYWVASKCRISRWTQAMKDYQQGIHDGYGSSRQTACWLAVRPVLEEILGSDVLTRVWTGLGCGWDQRRQQVLYEPLLRSVSQGHVEARNRVLNIMVYGRGFSLTDVASLNRFRGRMESWTDMLLGYVMAEHDVREFAFDAERTEDFAESLRGRSHVAGGDPARQLLLATLRGAFQSDLHRYSPNAELNRRIATSILACLDEDLFDATGMLRSAWIERLYSTTHETQGMIADLLAMDAPPGELPGDRRHLPRF
jgi:hypothetical protein